MTRCWTQIELELEQTVQKVECRQNRLRNGVNLKSKLSSLVVRWTTQQIVGWDRGGQNWFPPTTRNAWQQFFLDTGSWVLDTGQQVLKITLINIVGSALTKDCLSTA